MPPLRLDDLSRLVDAREAARTGAARDLRVAAGLSQAEVAATVGVAAPTISLWESGHRVPRGEPARRYAQLLAVLAERYGEVPAK